MKYIKLFENENIINYDYLLMKWENLFNNSIELNILNIEKNKIGYYKKQLDYKHNKKKYNFSIIIEESNDNVYKFINKLRKLHDIINKISNLKNITINWEIDRNLNDFLNNNVIDIYWYDENLKLNLFRIINKWIKIENIKINKIKFNKFIDVSR